ncbi:hypothetical protein Ate01nite_56210 [Actinoplanes teichomyceticus]|nr:hypothetical protein Ate01nite_56210 [Actinoplanes teichomyceticus]
MHRSAANELTNPSRKVDRSLKAKRKRAVFDADAAALTGRDDDRDVRVDSPDIESGAAGEGRILDLAAELGCAAGAPVTSTSGPPGRRHRLRSRPVG